ncbi:MAG TPA: DUF1579 family protein [Thermoanaerobaculia bacterium]|jgi:hypothetical protein
MKNMMIGLILTLLTSAAFAAPAANVQPVAWFAGHWQCSGIAYANPMAPEHPTRATVNAQWTMDGHWLRFDYAEIKTPRNPMPFAVTGFFGYDPELKQFVIGSVDNMGGYSTSGSSGWDGDSIVFTGPWHMGTMTATGRDTFTKMGANKMTHTAEIQQNGNWMKAGQETCTRGASK